MMRTRADYLHQLINLLPFGIAWPGVGVSNKLTELLNVIANELLQVETSINALIDELIPSTTNELIDRWENIMGLPDPCTGPLPTLQKRVKAVVSKLFIVGDGNLSEQFYIDSAAALGFTITITVLSANHWQVNSALTNITFFRVGVSSAGDPLQSSSIDQLVCFINRVKPAHTLVTFNFT